MADLAIADRPAPHGRTGRAASVLVTLGMQVCITRAGESPQVLTGKAAALLALVGIEGAVDRRRVSLMLWPDSPECQARNNLRTLVHRLNRRVGTELLVGVDRLTMDEGLVRLALLQADDLLAVLAAGGARDCELLSEAAMAHDGSEAFGAWLQATRQRMRRLQLDNLSEALADAEARGDAARAISLARACVQLEPFSEQWHRQLMNTLARSGDRAAALAAYEELKVLLRRHLGASPDVRTRTVQLRILQGQADDQAGAATGSGTPSSGPAPAPAAPSARLAAASPGPDPGATPAMAATALTPLCGAARYPLVERDEVLARARAALAKGRHLVLRGEPGVGKTRLLRCLGEPAGSCEQLAIFPGARDEPYAALAQLLLELQARRGARVPVSDQIELARMAPMAFAEVTPSQARLLVPRLHAALGQWLKALRVAGVTRLVIDNVHDADIATQAALAAMLAIPADATGALPCLVLAHRSGETSQALDEARVSAQVAGRLEDIALPRLTLAGVGRLLRAMGLDDSLAEQHLQRTGGNPLFVIELAQHVLDDRGDGRPSPNLDALLVSRLRGCSAAAQQLAATAAVAGADFSVELAASVLGHAPLSLMPAWSELQQRGLFADHGLAHDLVRDAVLGALPAAIAGTLHGQLAAWLEGQGQQGAPVLRHWLAAGNWDRALAHAVHHLHATSAAGLSTLQLEVDLVDLLARTSDRVLLDNLWLTGEVGSSPTADFALAEAWPRLKTLLERVGRLHDAAPAAAWIAYESARQAYHVDRSVKTAWTLLNEAATLVPPTGIARARIEQSLAFCARIVHGDGREHARRARQALAGLPDDPCLRRILLAVDRLEAADLSAAEVIRKKAPPMRAARRRGDVALAFEARVHIAMAHAESGSDGRAYRHFMMAARTMGYDHGSVDRFESLATVGIVALKVGRYDIALRCFQDVRDAQFRDDRPAYIALAWLRMGDVSRAMQAAREIRPPLIQRSFLTVFVSAIVRAGLDELSGDDPLPALRRARDVMLALGIDGVNLGLMSWEITLRAGSPAERWQAGRELLASLREQGASPSRLVCLLVGVAEAAACIGQPHEEMAREASRMLRRGCASLNLYVPDGFVRCARLLRATDPAEAASLLHVARRWVQRAMRHVPPEARDGFGELPVNRRLLGSRVLA